MNTKVSIHRKRELEKNKILIRYTKFGDVDFAVSITRNLVISYLHNNSDKSWGECSVEAYEMRSKAESWATIEIAQDENFYKFVKWYYYKRVKACYEQDRRERAKNG